MASPSVPTASARSGTAFSDQYTPACVAMIFSASAFRFRATVATNWSYCRSISDWMSFSARSDSGSCGYPHEPLSERAEKDIQSEIDRQYDQFVATVARNRKADAEK